MQVLAMNIIMDYLSTPEKILCEVQKFPNYSVPQIPQILCLMRIWNQDLPTVFLWHGFK